MKKTEIATMIFVASLSMMITYFVTNMLIGDKAELTETVKTAKHIPEPPHEVQLTKQFFNDDPFNPTVEVYVKSDNFSTNINNDSSGSTPVDSTTDLPAGSSDNPQQNEAEGQLNQ